MEWENFWNTYPEQFHKDDFLRQVGKTFHGQPISKDQIDLLITNLAEKIDLQEKADVLDLCCGNGYITSAIATSCSRIVGVDFSKFLIDTAREFHSAANTIYFCMSVLDITAENIHLDKPFDKIYMYEALQHFSVEQFEPLLKVLLQVSDKNSIILLASIPHKYKLRKFYDTPERRRDFYERKRKGNYTLGTWWSQSTIRKICADYKLRCEFMTQPGDLYTAHYRFDVRIMRR